MVLPDNLMEWTDTRLVSECRRGNQRAWDELIRRYSPMIYGISRRYRLTPEDCIDAFGQVCKTLLENLHQLREAERLAAYISTTVQRTCLAIIRGNERRLLISEELYHHMGGPSPHGENPDDVTRALLRGHLIRRALDMQDERCRKLLWHLFFDPDEPEYAQISKRLNMPVASIGPTRSRCLEKFRRTLAELGFRDEE